MELYKLEQKLDIIISILNNNMEVMNMAKCPYCEKKRSVATKHSGSIDLGDILYNSTSRQNLFKYSQLVNCYSCKNSFYIVCKILGNNIEEYTEYSIEKDYFEGLKVRYYDKVELVNYLPESLKESYSDALAVFESTASNRQKLATTRLIIEEYLRYTNGVDEADRIRIEINKIENKELRSALHKIVDETIKAIHAKKELPAIDAQVALKTLELLFTLLYKLPKEHEKIQEEYRQKRENMESQFSNILKSL